MSHTETKEVTYINGRCMSAFIDILLDRFGKKEAE